MPLSPRNVCLRRRSRRIRMWRQTFCVLMLLDQRAMPLLSQDGGGSLGPDWLI